MRRVINLTDGWKFIRTDLGTETMPLLTDERWQDVTVPHDWAITGKFSSENDPQPLEKSVLDYHEGMIQIGRTGGLPFIGTGWYVRDLEFSEKYSYYGLEFDGIMNHGKIYINGQKVAERPFGYSSFCVDLSDFAKENRKIQLTVKVDSMDKTSRWYPGAGIFRPVRLVMSSNVHFAYNGIQVKCMTDLEKSKAALTVISTVEGISETVSVEVRHTIYQPDGCAAAVISGNPASVTLSEPVLWDLEYPRLYKLVSEIVQNGKVVDQTAVNFGIRSVVFDKEKGFYLNNRNIKIQGVCMHHDLGMLGAAYREDVMRKRLQTLKEMGCNALRTTHNPPCLKTLDLCDEMGILVLDEAFDEWTIPKTVNGYANEFPGWAERDLIDMIRRDRNHPCVILYSIGNEIPDQVNKEGRDTCKWLVEICHKEDDTRLVTCGFNRPKAAVENGLTEEVDIVGLNYCARDYEKYHREHPDWLMLGTETMSAVASRGEYYLPAELEMPVIKRENLQVNSFDYSAVACAYIADIEFEAQRKAPFVAGQFVWTGYDYLGEPTPYREEWPSRSSYFGILDLAGMKKDRYYGFAAEWSEKPVLHLFPHWNWEKGQLVDVHCYTNLEKVRIYVNGKEQKHSVRRNHRIVLRGIPFESGELRAAGYKIEQGKEILVCEDVVRTAGKAEKFSLQKDMEYMHAGSSEVCFVDVAVTDAQGTVCPDADNRIDIMVEGAGEYLASDAGDATSLRRFQEPYCHVFHGKMRIALQAGKEAGLIRLRVSSDGIETAQMIIEVKQMIS